MRLTWIVALLCSPLAGCHGGNPGIDAPDALPVILSISTVPLDGYPGEQRLLTAEVEGAVDSWTWTFGDGAYPRTSGEEAPAVALARPGAYTLRVVATNAAGDSLPFELEYTVTVPSDSSWQGQNLGELLPGPLTFTHLAVLDGHPCVVTHGYPATSVECLISRTPRPTTPADWSRYPLSVPLPAPGNAYSIQAHGERLYWVYEAIDGQVVVAYTNPGLPLSASAWHWSQVAASPESVSWLHLGELAGRLALVFDKEELTTSVGGRGLGVAVLDRAAPDGPQSWYAESVFDGQVGTGFFRWIAGDELIIVNAFQGSYDPAVHEFVAVRSQGGPADIEAVAIHFPEAIHDLRGDWGTANYFGALNASDDGDALGAEGIECYWHAGPASDIAAPWQNYSTGFRAVWYSSFGRAVMRPVFSAYTQVNQSEELGVARDPALLRSVTPEPTAAGDWIVDSLLGIQGGIGSPPPFVIDFGDRIGLGFVGSFNATGGDKWLLTSDQPW